MSFLKKNLKYSLESQSYLNESFPKEEMQQTRNEKNNNCKAETQNNILTNINDSVFEDVNSINNSINNIFPINAINFVKIREIGNHIKNGNNGQNKLKDERILQNKSFKFTIMKLGRKKKNENIKSEHNKFSDDILRRKVKHLVLKNLMKFINEKIYFMYKGDIGHNIYIKQLLTINGNQNSNATIKFNQNFLKKKLGDIFSENISSKYSNYDLDHNEKLIKYLKKEDDEKKRLYFIKFFNLTFLQGLKHYIGEEYIEELNGLRCFNEDKNGINEDEEYIEMLDKYIKNFEKNIMKKKERPKRETQKI